MKLIANRQLYGTYGLVPPNVEFECPNDIAYQLLKDGKARKAEPPKAAYEVKIIQPSEVGITVPFRDLPMLDAQQTAMASEGNRVLSEPNLSSRQSGTADNSGRPKRFRLPGKRLER